MRMYNPAHPGELLQEYLENHSVSITQLAEQLGVTRVTLSRIVNGKSAITAEMAIRLGQVLKTSPELWLGMQTQYDLWQAEQKFTFQLEPLIA